MKSYVNFINEFEKKLILNILIISYYNFRLGIGKV